MNELTNKKIAALRVDYSLKEFDETHVLADPIKQFSAWFQEALETDVNEPNAMTLATVKQDNTPSARVVLLKGFSESGFSFFTNYNSHKGQQLLHNPNVALVFCWLELQRQVRIEGKVSKLSKEESDDYFYSRPLSSQIGAIASPQSTVIEGRHVLEQIYNAVENKLNEKAPERPEHWGGFKVEPTLIEFWQGRSSRLHDRFEFVRNENGWKYNRLAP
jgi:pyridoxamine 5'-phosphate oxidase